MANSIVNLMGLRIIPEPTLRDLYHPIHRLHGKEGAFTRAFISLCFLTSHLMLLPRIFPVVVDSPIKL